MREKPALSYLVDLVFLVVFVTVGRSVHGHGDTLAGIAKTLWPFAAGLSAGWVALFRGLRRGSLPIAAALAATTALLGQFLRVVSGQGTAFPFILVSLGFVEGTFVGWRVLVAAGSRGLASLRRAAGA